MRLLSPKQAEFVTAPGWMTLALVTVTIGLYAFVAIQAGTPNIPVSTLQRYGALSSAALGRAETWRFLAYGFLHAAPAILALNMVALLAWGSLVEKHLGVLQYLLVYAVALAGAGLIGIRFHPAPFLFVGAAGAVSGLFGALLCLCILGRIPLPLTFFIAALALNAGLFAIVPRADWSVAVGGLAAGFVAGGLLGMFARMSDRVLRCKHPEWVKLETALAFGFGCYAAAASGLVVLSVMEMTGVLLALACGAVLVKLVDLILSMKRGLAIVSILFALVYAAVPFVFRQALTAWTGALCTVPARPPASVTWLDQITGALCAQRPYAVYVAMALAFIAAIILHIAPLRRGLRDVGFVGAGFRGERKRASA